MRLKKTVTVLLVLVLLLGSFPVSVMAAENISRVDLTVPLPKADDEYHYTLGGNCASISVSKDANYTVRSSYWWNGSTRTPLLSGKFTIGNEYFAEVYLTPKDGFEYSKDMAFYINGVKQPKVNIEFPENVELPDDIKIPDNIELPDGINLPEGTELPDLADLLDGIELPEGTDLSKLAELLTGIELPEGAELPDLTELLNGIQLPNSINLRYNSGSGAQRIELDTVTVTRSGMLRVRTKNFTCAGPIDSAAVTGLTDQVYTGKKITPPVTVTLNGKVLAENTDYTVSYENNTNVGTASVKIKGKGIYTGTKTVNFRITPASIRGAAVTGISDQTYTGQAITQEPVVKLHGKTLKNGTDYTVRYANNVLVGTAVLTIVGTGNYTGMVTKTFRINRGPDPNSIFEDVRTTATYYRALVWAVDNGIITGTTPTTFSPDDPCTRYQFAVMLYKLAGKPAVTGERPNFTDVSEKASYYDAVSWAYGQGIIVGTTETTFSPYDPVKRYQVVKMLYKMAGKPETLDLPNPFRDVSPSDSYYDAVMWAAQNFITTGTTPTTFSPQEYCKRYQVVVFLYRYNNIYHIK